MAYIESNNRRVADRLSAHAAHARAADLAAASPGIAFTVVVNAATGPQTSLYVVHNVATVVMTAAEIDACTVNRCGF